VPGNVGPLLRKGLGSEKNRRRRATSDDIVTLLPNSSLAEREDDIGGLAFHFPKSWPRRFANTVSAGFG
jgi:hypothetical protein